MRIAENVIPNSIDTFPAQMRFPFVIIAALQDEADVILNLAESSTPLQTTAIPELRQSYEIKVPNVREKGVLAVLPEMGRLSAVATTLQAIVRWQPKFIVVVGIAGGIRTKGLHLGDVIVVTCVHDYEQQKITQDTNHIRWEHYLADSKLLSIAKQAVHSSAVATDHSNSRPWKVHFGPILSGEKIVASGQFATELVSSSGDDALGFEMEGAGVAYASRLRSVPMIMVRGIADFADEKKSQQMSRWRKKSCESAARFAFSLLSIWSHNQRPSLT